MRLSIAAAALAGFIAAPAMAAQTFTFTYQWGSAQAVGTFDLDHSGMTLAAGDYDALVGNIHMTVTGAASGNGDFTSVDFSRADFTTDADLDLTRELVGQAEPHGTFGDYSHEADLNFFARVGSSAPNGVGYFDLLPANNDSSIHLTSLHVVNAGAVPEPASWALMVGGFGMIGGALRRRQRTALTFA